MSEKTIVNAIIKYLKTLNYCFCFKEHGGIYSTSGIPDIIACIGGRFVAFEVKTPSGKLSMLQESMLKKINSAKGIACKVTSVEEVKAIVAGLTEKSEVTS